MKTIQELSQNFRGRVYTCNALPRAWIVGLDGLWIVEGRSDGWRERKPYVGHRDQLIPVQPMFCIGCGVPGLGGDA